MAEEVQQSSYSALTKHRACPQEWFYATQRKLERDDPESVKAELEFGNWWHALRAADSIERGRSHGSLRSIPKNLRTVDGGPTLPTVGKALRDGIYEIAAGWWEGLTQDYQGIWVERLGEPLVDRLRRVEERWAEEWSEEIAEEHPVAVEMFWKRHLPESAEGDPRTRLIGFIDEVFWDARRRMLVIRDHKTHRSLNTSAEADLMDSQLQVYAWGATPAIAKFGLGKPRAIAYDRVRMVAPKSPSITTTGTLSKSVTDYDLATYLEFVGAGVPWGEDGAVYASGPRKGQPKFGTYAADPKVVAHLSDPASRSIWFQRTRTPINPNIVRAHLQAAVDTSHDISRTLTRSAATGQAARNLSKNCKWCDFASLCLAEMVGGVDGEYDLAEHRLRPKPERKR